LLQGGRGTAGFYGLWQRLRTRTRGEQWVPDHPASESMSRAGREPSRMDEDAQ